MTMRHTLFSLLGCALMILFGQSANAQTWDFSVLSDTDIANLNADTDNRLDRLTQLIDHLEPPLRQQIFRLRYLQGLSYQEVAHAVGVSKVTVYHHLAQAIEWIKSKLK